MTVTIDGTNGITSPGGDVASASLQTPVLQSASTLTFKTNGTTTAMTVDASQNVGIGTASPANKLHVYSPSVATTQYLQTGTTAAYLRMGNSVATDGYIGYEGTGGNNMTFYTAATERMRIDSSGNLLVGTTSVQGVGGISINPNGGAPRMFWNKSYSGTAAAAEFDYNTTAVGFIYYSNTATTYATSSDYRLKENVAPMTNALDKISALKPCTYTWKTDGSSGQGFIAHELQEIIPEAVTGTKNAVKEDGTPEYQGIDTSFLVATLTAAIQELNAKVEALEAKLA